MGVKQSSDTVALGEIHIDIDLNLYDGFFDLQWANRMFSLARNTKLEMPVANLCATWKGISNARRLPWMMMHVLKTHQEQTSDRYVALPTNVLQMFVKRLADIAKERYVSLSNRAQ